MLTLVFFVLILYLLVASLRATQVEGYSLYLDGADVNRSVVGVPAALGGALSWLSRAWA